MDTNGSQENKSVNIVTDVIDGVLPTYIEKRQALKRNITPFFLLTIITFLTLYDIGLPDSLITFDKITLFTNGGAETGVTISQPRIVVIYGFLISLWVLFIRFGVLYYQLLDQSRMLIKEIRASNLTPQHKGLYQHIVKDAYVVDALLVFFEDAEGQRKVGRLLHILLSLIVVIAFVLFIGTGQYLTLVGFSAFSPKVGVFVFLLYLSYYILFIRKIFQFSTEGEDASSTVKQGNGVVGDFISRVLRMEMAEVLIVVVFVATSFISTALNFMATNIYEGVSVYKFEKKIKFDGVSSLWTTPVFVEPIKSQ